jgi:hypothetical protein
MLNRPVRTRLQGGVGGGIRENSPYPVKYPVNYKSWKLNDNLRVHLYQSLEPANNLIREKVSTYCPYQGR